MPAEDIFDSPRKTIVDLPLIQEFPGEIPFNPGPPPPLGWFARVFGLREAELCDEPLPADFFDLGNAQTLSEFWHWCQSRRNVLRVTEAAAKAGRFYCGEVPTGYAAEVDRLCRCYLEGFGAEGVPEIQRKPPLPSEVMVLLSWAMGWCVNKLGRIPTAGQENQNQQGLPSPDLFEVTIASPVQVERTAAREHPSAEHEPNLLVSSPESTEPREKGAHEYSFVRLVVGEEVYYQACFLEERATLLKSKGLWMVEFLVKQPGMAVSPLDLNKACDPNPAEQVRTKADETAWSESGNDEDKPSSYVRDDVRAEEPASPEIIARVKVSLEEKQQWLREANEGNDESRARREEQDIRRLQQWIREQERLQRRLKRGRPAVDSPSEKARKRWANNLDNAIKKVREAGLRKLAQHFEDHIKFSGGTWVYVLEPAINWHFDD